MFHPSCNPLRVQFEGVVTVILHLKIREHEDRASRKEVRRGIGSMSSSDEIYVIVVWSDSTSTTTVIRSSKVYDVSKTPLSALINHTLKYPSSPGSPFYIELPTVELGMVCTGIIYKQHSCE